MCFFYISCLSHLEVMREAPPTREARVINPAVGALLSVWTVEGGGEGLRFSRRNEASYFVSFGPYPDCDDMPRR